MTLRLHHSADVDIGEPFTSHSCTANVQQKLATETVTAEKPLLSLITISVRGQMLKMAFTAQLDQSKGWQNGQNVPIPWIP